jgi:CsoR family transcriptional regulator, copper-sensing transcriptional repressor
MQTEKEKALLGAKKAAGTLAKVILMIEKNEYCPAIIQQMKAVEGLLHASTKQLLQGHLSHCLAKNMATDSTKAIAELMQIMDLKK